MPQNNCMKSFRSGALVLAVFCLLPTLHALEKQSGSVYHARREALAAKLHGGVAVLFAAEEPQMEYQDYRQDEDFFYLTGWNEPGAVLLVAAPSDPPSATAGPLDPQGSRGYTEILFLPTRNLRLEKYTGVKLDAATSDAAQTAGVDRVMQMTDLPKVLSDMIASDRRVNARLGPGWQPAG